MDPQQRVDEAKRRAMSYDQSKKDVRAMDNALDELHKLKRESNNLAAEAQQINKDLAKTNPEALGKKMSDLNRKLIENRTAFDFQKAKMRYAAFHVLAEMEIW